MEDLRSKSPLVRITVYVLFGLLILSFGLWGIGDYITSSSAPDEVAEVGDRAIPLADYDRRLRLEARQLQRQSNQPVTPEMLVASGIAQRSLRVLVEAALLDNLAQDLGLAAGPQQVAERIAQQQAFQNARGQFDPERYRQTLRSSGLDPKLYEAEVAADLPRQYILDTIRYGAEMPAEGAQRIFAWREEERDLSYVTLPAPDPLGIAAPDEETLTALYEERKANFRAPEFRKVTLLHITADAFLDSVEVDPKELAEAVTNEEANYGTPELRAWRQIIFADEAAASAAKAEVEAGASLADAAAKHGGSAPTELSLQPKSRIEGLLPQLADAVFSDGRPGDVLLAETPIGWHVIEISEVVPSEAAAPEQVEAAVREDLEMEKAVDAMVAFANEVDAELATGATLDETANALGLSLQTVEAVDRQGRDRSGARIEGLPSPDEFLDLVFTSDSGIDSLLQEASDGSFYAFRVDAVTPAADRPFEEVRPQVLAVWRSEESERRALAKAEALAKRIDAGEVTLAEAAQAEGQPVITAPPLSRTSTPAQLRAMPTLVRAAFQTEPGKAVTAQVPAGAALGQVTQVTPVEPQDDEEGFQALQRALDRDMREDLLSGFLASLESLYPVRYNGEALDRVLSAY